MLSPSLYSFAMRRRTFLGKAVTVPAVPLASRLTREANADRDFSSTVATSGREDTASLPHGHYRPGRIPNEYNLFLPGERDALVKAPSVSGFEDNSVAARWSAETRTVRVGETIDGWQLVAILPWLNGTPTAVFEKHVTHQGAIAYVTEMGKIAHIPKRIGDLSKIRPRPTRTPHGVRLERPARYLPGPDVAGDYILDSDEDPTPPRRCSPAKRRSASLSLETSRSTLNTAFHRRVYPALPA